MSGTKMATKIIHAEYQKAERLIQREMLEQGGPVSHIAYHILPPLAEWPKDAAEPYIAQARAYHQADPTDPYTHSIVFPGAHNRYMDDETMLALLAGGCFTFAYRELPRVEEIAQATKKFIAKEIGFGELKRIVRTA